MHHFDVSIALSSFSEIKKQVTANTRFYSPLANFHLYPSRHSSRRARAISQLPGPAQLYLRIRSLHLAGISAFSESLSPGAAGTYLSYFSRAVRDEELRKKERALRRGREEKRRSACACAREFIGC